MPINPGMKMMMMQRTAQDRNRMQSEYGGGRRMIGYDRGNNGNASVSNFAESYAGNSMAYGGMEPKNRVRDEYDERKYGMGSEMSRMGGNGANAIESRRRRDSRGRYMMGGLNGMDDDETYAYRPQMMEGFPRMKGKDSYGNSLSHPSSHDDEDDEDEPVDEQTARRWVKKIDGGEHFRPEQADQLRAGICPECKRWEFYVALNAMYSDHCNTAKRMNMDKPEFYAHLAKDFLMDEDAKPNKLRKYMEHIAK